MIESAVEAPLGLNKISGRDELIVAGYKRIQESIRISELDTFNYFVGTNGSGKTSILTAIHLLVTSGHAVSVLGTPGEVRYQAGDSDQHILRSADGTVSESGDLRIKAFTLKRSPISGQNSEIVQTNFIYALNDMTSADAASTFDRINEVITDLDFSPIEASRRETFSQTIIYTQDGVMIDLELMADGVKSNIELAHFLDVVKRNLRSSATQSHDRFCITLEEPENNLHPNYQRRIPQILQKFFDDLPLEDQKKIRFFISTHSPFIVGGASSMPNSKVYLLEGGALVKFDPRTHVTETTNESSGYRGPTCAWIVSKMLGADVIDMGYPENYCIVEESSICQILNHCREIGLIKNIQFVSAGGEAKVIPFTERMQNLIYTSTLVKCNPYYGDRYHVIVDDTSTLTGSQPQKFEELRARLGVRYHELLKHSLENYYGNLDARLAEDFQNELAAESNRKEHGLIKDRYALRIKDQITSREEFSGLFENELNFLLPEEDDPSGIG